MIFGGVCGPVERSRDDQTGYRQSQQTGCRLRDDGVEVLFQTVDTTKEETHAHDQQQIGEHAADERGLDDEDLIVDQGDDGDDQFDGVAARVSEYSCSAKDRVCGTYPNEAFRRPPIVSPVL